MLFWFVVLQWFLFFSLSFPVRKTYIFIQLGRYTLQFQILYTYMYASIFVFSHSLKLSFYNYSFYLKCRHRRLKIQRCVIWQTYFYAASLCLFVCLICIFSQFVFLSVCWSRSFLICLLLRSYGQQIAYRIQNTDCFR